MRVLAEIERAGIKVEIGEKSNTTSGGYFGVAAFKLFDYQSIDVEINISERNGRDIRGEIDSVTNDFTTTYNLVHLPQEELVNEKIFSALIERKKPRDFYDLYIIMRKGMLSSGQKKKLFEIKDNIVNWTRQIDFRAELGAFLPIDQQSIIRDFPRALEDELNRQLA